MFEVELKLKIEHSMVIPYLEGLGFYLVGEEVHHDIYLNAPHKDFGVTDEALRLRQSNGKSYLTYKDKKINPRTKTRREIETPIILDDMYDIFLSLGFKETLNIEKKRIKYKKKDISICLDSVKGLGEFVEIETMADSNLNIYENQLLEILKTMNISEDKLISKSYLELLLDNGQ
ncbi:class IV adenylate cyclase [Methanosalsum natronophilum]|uniref:class IV adenylate cyclase n=1 Tax=Methanosalsum natronophilum TaxID=768733 RepID=UPI00216957AF|nr:class IV adenylate cyclase [Methanosalsum natronophilum]MCS3923476.1 adenylate cyclase class 2 [Methanosalsum natronophilum]